MGLSCLSITLIILVTLSIIHIIVKRHKTTKHPRDELSIVIPMPWTDILLSICLEINQGFAAIQCDGNLFRVRPHFDTNKSNVDTLRLVELKQQSCVKHLATRKCIRLKWCLQLPEVDTVARPLK